MILVLSFQLLFHRREGMLLSDFQRSMVKRSSFPSFYQERLSKLLSTTERENASLYFFVSVFDFW